MDEADLAFDNEQSYLTQALAAQRRRTAVLQAIGECHNCGNEDGIGQRLFCDAECASDWEYQDSLRRRLGLPGASYAGAGASGASAAA